MPKPTNFLKKNVKKISYLKPMSLFVFVFSQISDVVSLARHPKRDLALNDDMF
jgi:hypothetical protein